MTTRGTGGEDPAFGGRRDTAPGEGAFADLDQDEFARAFGEELDELEGLAEEAGGDAEFAELFASPRPSTAGSDLRRELRGRGDERSEDILQRLNTLDYIEGLVGERPVGEVPERLGDCRIRGLLGRGGMGAVYDGFQETLEREVAVKVLSPTLTADPRMRERFRNEARANASLHHQHIVPVFGFGEAAGLLYFTMEKVPGVSLDKHMSLRRRSGVDRGDLRAWAGRFAGVADALAHAHKRGILHRDVKPGNVLVHPDGTLALADFGLSKIMTEASVGLSVQGSFIGTLHYASPEQAAGRSVGPPSDLYSLGVTMFEAFTGELPVEGETAEALLQSILHGQPRRLRAFDKKAPKDLEAVLARLLAKEPSDRYHDGEELARDLQRVADGEPVRVRRQPLTVRAVRWMSRHRAVTAAGGLAVLVLVAVGLFLLALRDAASQRYQLLLREFITEVAGSTGAAAGPPGLLEVLVGLSPGDAARRRSNEPFEPLEEARRLAPGGDEAHRRYRDVYQSTEGVAAAVEQLVQGRALALLENQDRVRDELAAEAIVEPTKWLELYRLRMIRAVACLTDTVADVEMAEEALVRAETTRQQAFFPSLLRDLVTTLADGNSALLPDRLEPLVARGPEGAREVAGLLLVAFAGAQRPPEALAMHFAMPAREERRLLAVGCEWAGIRPGADWVSARTGTPFDRAMREALARSRDPSDLARAAARLGRLAPGSRSQCWSVVLALLDEPRNPLPRRADGRPMPVDVRIRGLIEYLWLWDMESGRSDLDAVGGTVAGLLAEAPRDDPAARQLEVLWRVRRDLLGVANPDRSAVAAADDWVQVASDDPEALVGRFQAHLLDPAGDRDQAACDLARALQLDPDPRELGHRVVAFLRRTLVRYRIGGEGERLCQLVEESLG